MKRRLMFAVALAISSGATLAQPLPVHPVAPLEVYLGYGPSVPDPYWYPPVFAAPISPVYIQRTEQPVAYWYYCADSKAYYPYVRECASPWLRVVPQPVSATPR